MCYGENDYSTRIPRNYTTAKTIYGRQLETFIRQEHSINVIDSVGIGTTLYFLWFFILSWLWHKRWDMLLVDT